jgi:hypothetical protein
MFVDILSLIARLGARSRWHDERWAKWRRPRRGVSALERCQSPGFDLALLVVRPIAVAQVVHRLRNRGVSDECRLRCKVASATRSTGRPCPQTRTSSRVGLAPTGKASPCHGARGFRGGCSRSSLATGTAANSAGSMISYRVFRSQRY